MAKEGNSNFDIPAEMRAFAEKSVEQAKQAFDTFISAAQHAVNTAETQAASARTGVKDVAELAMRFSERNIASSFEFAQRLLHARSHGAAHRLRQKPDRGAQRPGQGAEQAGGQDGREGRRVITPPTRIRSIVQTAPAWNQPKAVYGDLVRCNIYVCNAPK